MGQDETAKLERGLNARTAITELIYRANLYLDAKDFAAFFKLCDEKFHYIITAHSPEIRKDMLWLDKDRKGMKDLFDLMPKQNMDRTPLTRHFSLFLVERGSSDDRVKVTSALQLFRTETQGGITSLVAVGKYIDEIRVDQAGAAELLDREVRLETRMLGKGYHVPF